MGQGDIRKYNTNNILTHIAPPYRRLFASSSSSCLLSNIHSTLSDGCHSKRTTNKYTSTIYFDEPIVTPCLWLLFLTSRILLFLPLYGKSFAFFLSRGVSSLQLSGLSNMSLSYAHSFARATAARAPRPQASVLAYAQTRSSIPRHRSGQDGCHHLL